MADGKKSFVLYADIIHTVRKMPKDKAGELFMAILSYVNDENPVIEDMVIDLVFEPIKQQLKRDLKKWEGYIEKQRTNGQKGGRPHKPTETEKTQAFSKKPVQPKKADSVNVSVSVNDSVSIESTKELNTVVVEKEINNTLFQFFRRSAGSHISDKELRQEVGRFRNKYPNIHPNQSGGLINAWVANIGKEKPVEKKMVL